MQERAVGMFIFQNRGREMSTITTKEKDDQINEMEIRIEQLEAENNLLNISLGATNHAFTDYRASYAMKACMMCNSLERVHCYENTERLEAKIIELEAEARNA
jgi:hypothetical protein